MPQTASGGINTRNFKSNIFPPRPGMSVQVVNDSGMNVEDIYDKSMSFVKKGYSAVKTQNDDGTTNHKKNKLEPAEKPSAMRRKILLYQQNHVKRLILNHD